MSYFSDTIKQSGKGLVNSKDIIYLLDVNLGGTLGTYKASNLGRDVENEYYASKLQTTGVIHRAVEPENGNFETSDLSISLANEDLEFSKSPWNYSILNKPFTLRLGFYDNTGIISVGKAYTLYKGLIKTETRGNKEFKLSIGDSSNKIFKDIPSHIVKVTEFPYVGTSVEVLGTKTDFETDLVGKKIPFIYGDFKSVSLIQPFFIDTIKHRYLIADHAIGTVSKVLSGGTQVFNFTHPNINGLVGGTHTGTNIMSFIDFGTSQGTKSVYVSIEGRYDADGVLLQNSALILKDILLSKSLCGLESTDIGTASFDIAETFLKQFNYRYILDGDLYKNTKDLIQAISVNSLSSFYFDKDNIANFSVYRPAVSRTYIRKIQQHEILEDSFSLTKDIRDVYNRVLVNYDYDWLKKEYRNAYEVSGTAYIDQYDTIKTFTIDSPFIYSLSEASFIGRRWLSKLRAGLTKVNFSTPISSLPLDIGERVQLSHDEPPSVSGGWLNRLLNIIDFEIDNKNKSINIQALDEEEVASKHYFILGAGTKFYRNASVEERKYGALCTIGGTMSNGDEGFILW